MSNASSICPSMCHPALPRTYVRNGRTKNLLTYQRNLAFRNARARIRDRGVVMSADDPTRDEIHDRVAWLKSVAKQGADQVHARAAFAKPVELTDAESAAIARKKLEARS